MLVAITDMQGRLQGKRCARPVLPRRGARARHRGLQLPARRRRRHEHRRRLRDVVLGARLRRLRDAPRTSTRCGWCRGTPAPRWCSCDVAVARRRPGAGLAAADPAPPARPAGRARPRRATSAPSWSSSSSTTPTSRPGTSGYRDLTPANQYNVDYSMLGTGADRAAAARHPQRDGRRRPVRRVRQGRVQPRPARDRVPVRRGAGHLRQPRDLQDRRQGDRRPARQEPHVHGEVRRARGQLLPHPPELARSTDGDAVLAGDGDARVLRS